MSTKDWKNGELNSLLLEKWGFKFDLDRLNEERTGSGVGHGPGDDDPDVGERESEGEELSGRELNEDEEEDLQEKAAFKKGEETESGTEAFGSPTKDEDTKDDEKAYVNEECPMSHGDEAEVMVVGDEGPEGAPAPEERAVELVDELRVLLMQLTGGVEGEEMMEEEEPDLEERRARGRKGPSTRGVPHPNLREEQVRQLVRTALKRVMEKKNG